MEKIKIDSLFDIEGNCLNDKETYFDEEGDLINYFIIYENYNKFPVDSDIVKIYYADRYAGETHGNYCSRTLFFRGY